MKTDIFNDFVPLLSIDNAELDKLAKEIAKENKTPKDRLILYDMCRTLSYLSLKIVEKL